ncbi:MAG: hypothetical protein MUF72_10635 [Elainella sp. Prado103]|jgi:hypothetical protein|nr:hypothetical protein [Elainella sp. Prado103]
MLSDYRLILYHKHPSSGRTLFLYVNETICQFEGLSSAAHVLESHIGDNQIQEKMPLLDALLADARQRLELFQDSLMVDREFNAWVDDSGKPLQIYLARFTSIDPPQERLARQGGTFLSLIEARRFLPPTELELLRLAYTTIMDDLS